MNPRRVKNGIAVIIPGGGSGVRMGSVLPKQFLALQRRPIIMRTIGCFSQRKDVVEIIVAVPALHVARMQKMLARYGLGRRVRIVVGGSDRQASVQRAFEALKSHASVVLIHDAVRPLVPQDVITCVAATARRWGAAVAAAKPRDTVLQEGKAGVITHVPDRTRLWNAQTPQGFQRPLFGRAIRRAAENGFRGTDDASLVLNFGHRVRVVESPSSNLKITSPEDLLLASSLLNRENRQKRVRL